MCSKFQVERNICDVRQRRLVNAFRHFKGL